MPIWVWIFLAVCIAYGGLVLWRAWAEGFVKYGPIRYTKQDDPAYFWFFVVLFCLAEIWFVGMLVIVVISLINGPIVDQRKCPTAHGWWKTLNCPSVDENGAYVPRRRP
jgi:hypothetical protein